MPRYGASHSTRDLGPARHHGRQFDDFEHNFKAHFCPVDDAGPAFEELKSWGHRVSHPRMANLQEWMAKFNALAAHTTLSDEDKQMRYCNALPHGLHQQCLHCCKDADSRTTHGAIPRHELTRHNSNPGGLRQREADTAHRCCFTW